MVADADHIEPTLMLWRRLLGRRYYESAELARRIAGSEDISYAPDLLHLTRATRSQTGLNPAGRKRNLTGAFKLSERWQGRIDGKHVLLTGDVLSIGANVERCSEVLKPSSASVVDVLIIAKAERPRPV